MGKLVETARKVGGKARETMEKQEKLVRTARGTPRRHAKNIQKAYFVSFFTFFAFFP